MSPRASLMTGKTFPYSLRPLCASMAVAFSLNAMTGSVAAAATINVTNCKNSGPGSLRSAVAAANSNDTVSLTGLAACTITLTTAEIPIAVSNLKIVGPANNSVIVNGADKFRIFHHTGTGTLTLTHLDLTAGKYYAADPAGGCIRSAGSVTLTATSVRDCVTNATSGKAHGGGIYAKGAVALTNSTITGNIAESPYGAYGAGVQATGFTALSSTLSNNYARTPSGYAEYAVSGHFEGGAVFSAGDISIQDTVIDKNFALGRGTKGGCIRGKGDIYLGASSVTNCWAYSNSSSQGGGISADGKVTLAHSIVSDNIAGGNGGASGGGLSAGSAVVNYSTIHGNYLGSGPNGFSGYFNGGGMFVYQGATVIRNSTIDGNDASFGGGVFGFHSNITITNSTISGNSASGAGQSASAAGAGIGMQATAGTAATLHISNSTIAFNTVPTPFGAYGGGGIRAYGTVIMDSTIVANNLKNGVPNDFSCQCGLDSAPTISGSENLVVAVDPASTAPPYIFSVYHSDPMLGPLAYHGGETATHSINPLSPAVDHGNNNVNKSYDQRGLGFARNVGNGVDIGAYERQLFDDEVFYNGFE